MLSEDAQAALKVLVERRFVEFENRAAEQEIEAWFAKTDALRKFGLEPSDVVQQAALLAIEAGAGAPVGEEAWHRAIVRWLRRERGRGVMGPVRVVSKLRWVTLAEAGEPVEGDEV